MIQNFNSNSKVHRLFKSSPIIQELSHISNVHQYFKKKTKIHIQDIKYELRVNFWLY